MGPYFVVHLLGLSNEQPAGVLRPVVCWWGLVWSCVSWACLVSTHWQGLCVWHPSGPGECATKPGMVIFRPGLFNGQASKSNAFLSDGRAHWTTIWHRAYMCPGFDYLMGNHRPVPARPLGGKARPFQRQSI